jgi:hypothetical protein
MKKEESRKKFFDSLLKSVLRLTSVHPDIKSELLKLLYEFVFEKNQGIEIKKLQNNRLSLSSSINNQPNDISLTNFNSTGGGSISLEKLNTDPSYIINKTFDEGNINKSSLDKKINSQIQTFLNDSKMIANMFKSESNNPEDTNNAKGKIVNFI